MSDLQAIEQRVAELKTELDELTIAARVLRRIAANGKHDTRRKRAEIEAGNDFAKMTIVQAASVILKESGQDIHYSSVADEAIKRGYHGRKGSTKEAMQKAFWATMTRNKEVFEATGGGKYKLR